MSASVPASATGGAPGFMASSGSAETARTSYCTSMRSSASSAIAGSSAATAATGWPAKTTRSIASTACARVGAFRFSSGMSAAVRTARTPGQRARPAHVDLEDARVSVRAAQELGVQEASRAEVGDVLDLRR